MKFGQVKVFVGVGILAAGAFGIFALTSMATVEFSFTAPDNKGSMTYRCHELETPQKTEENARAAHDFFAPAMMESARLQGKIMAQSMSPTRPSSELIPELEQINASADAQRKKLHSEMQSQFGCTYK